MKILKTLLILLVLAVPALGNEFPEPMRPARMVNDFSGLFSPSQNKALESRLRDFNVRTSTQIVVATIPSFNGYDPNDYAQRLAEKWGVGQRGKDNGILIAVQPKTARTRGQIAIAVGYGLEGVVPDAVASRIIRREIIPEFQQDRYFAGIDKACGILIKLTEGEFTAEEYAEQGESGNWILVPFLVFFFLPLFLRRRRGYTTGSHGRPVPPPIYFGGIGHRDDSFGSFSSGSGSFGGFGGFGGGSFGGGGASGSW